MMRLLHAGLALCLAAALCALAGCGLAAGAASIVTAPVAVVHSSPPPRLEVTVAPDANANSPVAVDVALTSSSKLQKLLSATTVANWFQQRQQWELDNPKQLRVLSWQWTPGEVIPPIALDLQGASTAVVFASYPAPGLKPMVIDPHHGLVLTLLRDGYAVSEAP